ncbi:MAG: MFS transporter [Thermoproteus sp.]|nr:MFS transporter [Thermoproteus sp.]
MVYALQWFHIAPLMPAILSSFGVPTQYAGFLSTAFIVGAASTQMPAGLLGAKIGNARTAGVGLLLLSSTSLLLGTSDNFVELLAFRALGGAGAGLFFSTAAAALAADGDKGLGRRLGAYNAMFNLGALAAMAWGFLGEAVGWRTAAALPSPFGIALSAQLLAVGGYRSRAAAGWRAVYLGLASAPFWGAAYAAQSLMPTWLQKYGGVGQGYSGLLTSASMLSGLTGGALGSLFDRTEDKRRYIVAVAAVGAAAFASTPFLPAFASAFAAFAFGFAYTLYITAIYALGVRSGGASALGAINFIDMSLGVWASDAFSLTMSAWPPAPWLLLASLAAVSGVAAAPAGGNYIKTLK